jgi:hypothetical protein
MNSFIVKYLLNLSSGLKILWCYLFWYLFFLVRYFRWDASLWGTTLFMSIVVGLALNFNAYGSIRAIRSGEPWKIARFFIIPFCVSSYPLLIREQNFILIFSPNMLENVVALILIAIFLLTILLLNRFNKKEDNC